MVPGSHRATVRCLLPCPAALNHRAWPTMATTTILPFAEQALPATSSRDRFAGRANAGHTHANGRGMSATVRARRPLSATARRNQLAKRLVNEYAEHVNAQAAAAVARGRHGHRPASAWTTAGPAAAAGLASTMPVRGGLREHAKRQALEARAAAEAAPMGHRVGAFHRAQMMAAGTRPGSAMSRASRHQSQSQRRLRGPDYASSASLGSLASSSGSSEGPPPRPAFAPEPVLPGPVYQPYLLPSDPRLEHAPPRPEPLLQSSQGRLRKAVSSSQRRNSLARTASGRGQMRKQMLELTRSFRSWRPPDVREPVPAPQSRRARQRRHQRAHSTDPAEPAVVRMEVRREPASPGPWRHENTTEQSEFVLNTAGTWEPASDTGSRTFLTAGDVEAPPTPGGVGDGGGDRGGAEGRVVVTRAPSQPALGGAEESPSKPPRYGTWWPAACAGGYPTCRLTLCLLLCVWRSVSRTCMVACDTVCVCACCR